MFYPVYTTVCVYIHTNQLCKSSLFSGDFLKNRLSSVLGAKPRLQGNNKKKR